MENKKLGSLNWNFDINEYKNVVALVGRDSTMLEREKAATIKLMYCNEHEWPYLTPQNTIWLFDTSKKRGEADRPLAFAIRERTSD